MRSALPCIAAIFLGTSSPAATFTITHFGTPAEAQPAIQRAADIWGSILVSDVPIKVSVSWFPLGASALGVTFPNGRKDFPGAPVAATWYASCLANSIAGTELNPGEDDINVYLNSGTNWYLGLDGNTPAGQYDLVTIALHELGHGLGFVGLAKKVGAEGSFGQVLLSDFAPLITTYPWPETEGLPGIFDRFLKSTASGQLVLLANPSTALGTAFTSNQVYFDGPYAVAANGGQNARIYAPTIFALGSSCVHLNESTYPVGNPNELMTPFGSPGNANHWPGPVAIGVMRDIGWTVSPDVGFTEQRPLAPWRAFVDAESHLRFIGAPAKEPVRILDIGGRWITTLRADEVVDVANWTSGIYLAWEASGSRAVRFAVP